MPSSMSNRVKIIYLMVLVNWTYFISVQFFIAKGNSVTTMPDKTN